MSCAIFTITEYVLLMKNLLINNEIPLEIEPKRALARSSHQMCSMKKGVLRNFAKFTGKHLCQRLFLNKAAGKKSLWRRCFPVNFAKFLRIPFSQNTSGRLLLRCHLFKVVGWAHNNTIDETKVRTKPSGRLQLLSVIKS